MKVPFFDYPSFYRSHQEWLRPVIDDVLNRGTFIMGPEVAEFEAKLAAFLGVQHAIGVGNCTDGLMIGLVAAGVGQGDEVIVPSHTMVATAEAIHFVGATPVLADCGEDHLVNVDAVRERLTPRTRAIVPVHLNGRVCDMDAITELASEHGLAIVEDAAQALGGTYKGRAGGSFGIAGAFSFYPAKLLGAFGDAGAVVTKDDTVADDLRALRNHGMDHDGTVVRWGINVRMDSLHAAVLSAKLDRIEAEIDRRREIAIRYEKGIGQVEGLVHPPSATAEGDHFDVFQNYELECDRRDELIAYLAGHGVGTNLPWRGKAVHQHAALGFDAATLPRTEALFDRVFMLPLNTMLSDDQVDYTIETVRTFFGI